MIKHSLLLILPLSAVILAGCASSSPAVDGGPGVALPPANETSEAVGEALPFATTPDATQISPLSESQLNYQTSYTVAQIAEFYRAQHAELTEREIVTVETEDTLNLVLDGDPNGAVVVQVVQLGENTRNVNVRYEDI